LKNFCSEAGTSGLDPADKVSQARGYDVVTFRVKPPVVRKNSACFREFGFSSRNALRRD